ncbi:MAG: hypothetical protein HC828_01350, partial [Blastochloris sp.]|nr:hypothetical protein [Blastochloris sp.]
MSLPNHRMLPLTMLGIVFVAALIACGMLFSRPAEAQELDLAITKTLIGSEVVQVGQILEFAVRITNTGTVPIVELELIDEFVGEVVAPAGIGPFAEPGDPPLSDTQPYSYDGAERITWQLLGNGQVLAAGESLEVIVRLRAIRPRSELTTVNRARIERAIRSDGGSSGGGSAEAPAR